MDTRIYHGKILAQDIAAALTHRFNRGNLIAQQMHTNDQYIVQISTRQFASSGGQTALGVTIHQNEDGVTVKLGKQAWLGIAASLGATLLSVSKNPLNLLSRLDDVAQDFENLNLDDQIWDTVQEIAEAVGASHDLSERLKRTGCVYCGTANPTGQPRCLACGAPLGGVQPVPCPDCGFIPAAGETKCSNCGRKF